MEQVQQNANGVLKIENGYFCGIEKNLDDKNFQLISSAEKPIISIFEKEINGERLFTGYFAYGLECISKPRTQEEEEKMLKLSMEFHRNLSNVLNNYYPHASYTIRIISHPEKKLHNNKTSPIEISLQFSPIDK